MYQQYTLRIVPEYSLFLLYETQVILTHNHSLYDTFIVTKINFIVFLIFDR